MLRHNKGSDKSCSKNNIDFNSISKTSLLTHVFKQNLTILGFYGLLFANAETQRCVYMCAYYFKIYKRVQNVLLDPHKKSEKVIQQLLPPFLLSFLVSSLPSFPLSFLPPFNNFLKAYLYQNSTLIKHEEIEV